MCAYALLAIYMATRNLVNIVNMFFNRKVDDNNLLFNRKRLSIQSIIINRDC